MPSIYLTLKQELSVCLSVFHISWLFIQSTSHLESVLLETQEMQGQAPSVLDEWFEKHKKEKH